MSRTSNATPPPTMSIRGVEHDHIDRIEIRPGDTVAGIGVVSEVHRSDAELKFKVDRPRVFGLDFGTLWVDVNENVDVYRPAAVVNE
jgi:hypothetical protein